MMAKIQVEMYHAPDIATARTIMSAEPAAKFDAVIVIPKTSDPANKAEVELRQFSEFICQPPYKIPMLGVFFDDPNRENVVFLFS